MGKAQAAAKAPARRGSVTNKELEGRLNEQGSELREVVQTVGNLDRQFSALDAKLDNVLNALSGMSAADRPTAFNQHRVESEYQDQGGGGEARIREIGSSSEIEIPRVMDVESPEFRAKQDELAFMNERLTIVIHDSDDEDADPRFHIWVNGKPWFFARGQRYENLPRYVVYGLCQARPMRYGNKEFVDRDNVMKVQWPMSRGLRYPFAVEYDPNPRGTEWLRRSLREP